MQAPPKFGSFRPKGAAPPRPTAFDNAPEERHKSQSRSDHGHRQHSQHASGLETRKKREGDWGRESPLETYEEPNNIFIIDRRGDRDNVTYGTNNKYAIPAYWPLTNRRILGLENTPNNLIPKASPLSSLTRQDQRTLGQAAKFVQPASSVTRIGSATLDEDYIPLKAGTKRKRGQILGERPASQLGRQWPLAETNATSDTEASEIESTSESEDEKITPISRLKEESARLSSRVKTESENVQAWREYIAYQDTWIDQGNSTEDENTHVIQRHSAPVKLSIYQKALSSIRSDNPRREILLTGMMEEAEVVLENAKLVSKWHELAHQNDHLNDLWLHYLNFIQINFTRFRLETCREKCAEHFRKLNGTKTSTGHQTYIFLRITAMLSDAGYEELAMALWQAAFEFNFFRPSHSRDLCESLTAFEEFWDNELPRIGEIDAKGWCNDDVITINNYDAHGIVGLAKPQQARDHLGQWYADEMNENEKSALPGRATDEAAGDDPFHIVLFSDIQPFLLVTFWETYPTTFLSAFLAFFHLPKLASYHGHSEAGLIKIPSDAFLRNEVPLSKGFTTNSMNRKDNSLIDVVNFDELIQDHLTTTEIMFETTETGPMRKAVRRLIVEKQLFVTRTLETVAERYPSWDELAEYSIAFIMHAISPLAAKKRARTLLKARSSDLRLYNAYGIIEARLGNRDASNKVFSIAIGMSMTLDAGHRNATVLLWRTWVWEAIREGDTTTAVQRLLSCSKAGGMIPKAEEVTIEDSYRTEAYLVAGITSALTSSNAHSATYYVELLALLHYLTTDPPSPSLPAALESYNTSLTRVSYSTSTLTIELIHQSQANLLSHHLSSSLPYQPSSIRAALTHSISLFHNNTLFLRLYRENEKRHRADDRVRAIVRGMLSTKPTTESHIVAQDNDNIITHAFAITTELQRGAVFGSTAHSVRAAFTRATSSRNCRHSATLWGAWLAYEVELLDAVEVSAATQGPERNERRMRPGDEAFGEKVKQQKKHVREVFLGGLTHLPWNKGFALQAGALRVRGVLTRGECSGVREGIVQRGLRVYVEPEEDQEEAADLVER